MQNSRLVGAATLAVFLAGIVSVIAQETQGQYQPPPPPRPLPPPSLAANTTTTTTETETTTTTTQPVPPKSITQTEPNDGPPPQFKINDEPRGLSTGYYGALLVGANFAHDDDLDNVGGITSASDSASVQPFASLKFGYTWPFNKPAVEQFSDVSQAPGLFFSGGLEVEGMYVRSSLGINTPTTGNNLTLNTGAIMFNAFLKAQSGKFRFYVGPGFGPAFVSSSDYQGSSGNTDVNLAYQFSGGIDYFITPEWSIFTEYKWFVLDDLKLFGGANKLDFGNMQQHLIGIGVRRSF